MSDNHCPENQFNTGCFHGRRKGKPLRKMQSDLIENILPTLRITLDERAPAQLVELFPVSVKEVRLEIGFGGGEHLIAQALRQPDIGFIGVEPFVNGMAKAVARISEHNIKNIRLYNDDAVKLLDWLPAQSLAQIDLLYPDPWPKKRNWKRRFVSDSNVAKFARVLKDGMLWRFASDIDTYVDWTLQHVRRAPQAFEWLAEHHTDWSAPWPHWVRTRYEAKAIREGRKPCYLQFKKVSKFQ